MRHLSLREILELHDRIIEVSGGARGIRDMHTLESAINQPRTTFDRTDLYPDILAKAAALCFFIVMNHPFIDGNKRVGHAAMETFLILNGFEIEASVDEQERIILDLANGKLGREEFTAWLNNHIINIT
ncbi:MAG: type II toxin-antitoxin system death-on-curing family toxin [Desulfobacterales bacterium]|nr:type II toxin-antitoxin system death-on-curing family toxin [Desulfobacterales bacterium]